MMKHQKPTSVYQFSTGAIAFLFICMLGVSFVYQAFFTPQTSRQSAYADVVTTSPTSQNEGEVLRIFHIDTGRKYFEIDDLKNIIDQLAEYNYTHLQLLIGNNGLRMMLDDMAVTTPTKTYSSSAVKSGIHQGNVDYAAGYEDGNPTEYTQAEMDDLIAYATSKGIGIIPMMNTPGHLNAIITAMEQLGISGVRYRNDTDRNNVSLVLAHEEGVAFTQQLVKKYADYFASRGCEYFHLGGDEYAQTKGGFQGLINEGNYWRFIDYINQVAAITKDAGMVPILYNDGVYYNNRKPEGHVIDTDIVVAYWTRGWGGYNLRRSMDLAADGFKIINASDMLYYTLGDPSWLPQYTYAKAMERLANPDQYGYNKLVDGYTLDVDGCVVCMWCDAPSVAYDNMQKERVANLLSTFAHANPTIFGVQLASIQTSDATYTGIACRPAVVVLDKKGRKVSSEHYTLAWKDNVNAGTATVVATAVEKSGYWDSVSTTFTIAPASLTAAVFSGIESRTYNGLAQTQKPVVKIGGRFLIAGIDYTLSYKNNVQPGTATVIATGKGNYTGSATATFKITKSAASPQDDTPKKPTTPTQPTSPQKPTTPTQADISHASITGIVDKWYAVDGKGKAVAQTQNIVVKMNGKTLKQGIDYTVSYTHNKARTVGEKKSGPKNAAASATVNITGKGSYKGSVKKTFQIKAVGVLRLYNPKTGEHLYTTDANEKRILTTKRGWRYEGIAFYAVGAPARGSQPQQGNTTTKPIYRVYQPATGEHHYTTDAKEVRILTTSRGWRNEGVLCWSNTDSSADVSVCMNRLYNPRLTPIASHHHTADTNEVKVLISSRGWKREGISWYGC